MTKFGCDRVNSHIRENPGSCLQITINPPEGEQTREWSRASEPGPVHFRRSNTKEAGMSQKAERRAHIQWHHLVLMLPFFQLS